MVVGPIEYIIVGFPGNKFNGEIAPELAKLIDSGLVRILDLVVITKDDSGEVAWFEFDQLDELAPFANSRVMWAASSARRTSTTRRRRWRPGRRWDCWCGKTLGPLRLPKPYVIREACSWRGRASPTSWRKRPLPDLVS